MFIGKTRQGERKLNVSAIDAARHFTITPAMQEDANTVLMSVLISNMLRKKNVFVNTAERYLLSIHPWWTSVVHGNVVLQDQEQRNGRPERKPLHNVINAERNSGSLRGKKRRDGVSFVLFHVRLIPRNLMLWLRLVSTIPVLGFRFAKESLHEITGLANIAVLTGKDFMFTMWSSSAMVGLRLMLTLSLSVLGATPWSIGRVNRATYSFNVTPPERFWRCFFIGAA